MYKFKMKLIYNEAKHFSTKTESLDFKITLPLTKLDIVGSGLISNGLVFPDHIHFSHFSATLFVKRVILFLASICYELSNISFSC